MPVPTHITARVGPAELDAIDGLRDTLGVSRTEALVIAPRVLMRSPDLTRRVRLELQATAFLERLRANYGPRAQLRFQVGDHDPRPRVDDEDIDWSDIDVQLRTEDGTTYVDLVDPDTGVGIRSAYWTEATDADVFIPLNAISVPTPLTGAEQVTRRLPDGRTAVEREEADGSIRRYVLDDDGRMSLLADDQRAEQFYEVPAS